MRTLAYILAYFLALQVAIVRLVPESWIYYYRVDFPTAKQNMAIALERAIVEIKQEIAANPWQEYVILLGDSVMYSGPVAPEQSIGYHIENWTAEHGRPIKAYNLAQPGMQAGDIYTVFLMLKARGIPLHRVAINLTYSGFVGRTPDQPVASFLGHELGRLDPQAFAHVRQNLTKRLRQRTWVERAVDRTLVALPIWRYRDVLAGALNARTHWKIQTEMMDPRPWHEKLWLKGLMTDPVYQRFYDPRPFDMTARNPQVYLLERLFRAAPNTDFLVVISPVNQALLQEWVATPGYRANVERLTEWLAKLPVEQLNLGRAMDPAEFVDHVHLTPTGYKRLATWMAEQLVGANNLVGKAY